MRPIRLVLLATLFTAPPALAEVTLKAVTTLPRNSVMNGPFLDMLKDLNAKGKGMLQIQYLGGPEVVPQLEQLSALQRGVFDIFFGPASYYDGQVPETGAHNASNRTAMELRKTGALDLLNQAFNKKANAQYLGYFGSGYTFHIYLKNEPKRNAAGGVDLTGLKIRGASIYRPFYDTQKITTINVQVPEMYSALERGVVDGIGWTTIGVTDNSWDKFLKYRVFPSFWQGDLVAIANLDAWRKLPPKAQALLQNTVIETEKSAHEIFSAATKKQEEQLRAVGMKDVQPSAEESKRYANAAFNSLWEQLSKRLTPAEVATLRKAFYQE